MLRKPLGQYTILLPVAVVALVCRYFAHVAGLGTFGTSLVVIPAIGISFLLLRNIQEGRPTLSFAGDAGMVAAVVISVAIGIASTLICEVVTLSPSGCAVVQFTGMAITAAAMVYFIIFWRRA